MVDFQIPTGATMLSVQKVSNERYSIEWLAGKRVIDSYRINLLFTFMADYERARYGGAYLMWLGGVVKGWEQVLSPTDTQRAWKVANNG